MSSTAEKNLAAVIVGAGDMTDRGLSEERGILIAADGGLRHLTERGLVPDAVIGDFDSLGYVPDAAEVITLKVHKDDTDVEAACRYALGRGFRKLRLYGISGSRPDHFLGNLQLAAGLSRAGAEVVLEAPLFTVYVLTDGEMTLRGEKGTTFSVLSHTDRSEGVTIEGGAEYPLEDEDVDNLRTLGVSNRMTGEEVRVSVRHGTLLVFLYCSPDAAE